MGYVDLTAGFRGKQVPGGGRGSDVREVYIGRRNIYIPLSWERKGRVTKEESFGPH